MPHLGCHGKFDWLVNLGIDEHISWEMGRESIQRLTQRLIREALPILAALTNISEKEKKVMRRISSYNL